MRLIQPYFEPAVSKSAAAIHRSLNSFTQFRSWQWLAHGKDGDYFQACRYCLGVSSRPWRSSAQRSRRRVIEFKAKGESMSIKPVADDVFIIADVQNDFLRGGALAVKNGDQVIAPINALARKFFNVVQIQDWHTKGHISFASAHSGAKRSK